MISDLIIKLIVWQGKIGLNLANKVNKRLVDQNKKLDNHLQRIKKIENKYGMEVK